MKAGTKSSPNSFKPFDCPACSGGCHGVHADATFKLRQLHRDADAHGLPLIPSFAGELEGRTRNNRVSLHSVQLENFRLFMAQQRSASGKPKPASLESDDVSTCPEFRSEHQKKCSGKGDINGVHVGVCRHNVASLDGAAFLDTVL